MNYWLVKTEPETFGWDDLIREGISMWDGVRNYQARNNIRIADIINGMLLKFSTPFRGILLKLFISLCCHIYRFLPG